MGLWNEVECSKKYMRSDLLKECHDIKLFEVEKMETSCFGVVGVHGKTFV